MLNFKNIQAYTKTFGIIFPIILFINYFSNKIILTTFLFSILLWISPLYFLFYNIFLNKNNNNINNIKYNSILKDKTFLIFKNNLFNFYYIILIILISYCLNHYNLYFLIKSLFNLNIIYFFILIIGLTNSKFVLILFNFYNYFNQFIFDLSLIIDD
jgi:hypothetical protein